MCSTATLLQLIHKHVRMHTVTQAYTYTCDTHLYKYKHTPVRKCTIQSEDDSDVTQLGGGCDTVQSTDGGTTSIVRSITTSHDLFYPKE